MSHEACHAAAIGSGRPPLQEEVSPLRSAAATAAAEVEEARSQALTSGSQVRAVRTTIERSAVRAPADAEVLQVRRARHGALECRWGIPARVITLSVRSTI